MNNLPNISFELIPFFIYFLLKALKEFKGKKVIFIAIFLVVGFFKGLFPQKYNLNIDIILHFLIVIQFLLILNNKKIIIKGLIPFLLFFISYLFSVLINDVDALHGVFYFLPYLINYLCIIIGANLSINRESKDKIFKLVKNLVYFQVVASLIKLIKYGSIEPIVGSIQLLGGTASTVIVLVISNFIISYLLVYNRKEYYLFGIPFLIGFSSGKRAIWIYIPLLIFLQILVYLLISNKKDKFLKYSSIGIIISVAFIYAGLRLTPTLNPENEIGGSFDIGYALYYIDNYNNASNSLGPTQRISGMFSVIERLNEWELAHYLFGNGPDFIDNWAIENPNFRRGFWGRITSITYYLTSFGLIGFILLYHFIIYFFRGSIILYRNRSNELKYIRLVIIGYYVIIGIDVIYSRSSIINHVLSPLMFLIIGLMYNKKIILLGLFDEKNN